MSENKLNALFERLRQRAVDKNEPTAFVLGENSDQIYVDSFSLRSFDCDEEDLVEKVMLEARTRNADSMVWLIDIFSDSFPSQTDAFEMAWRQRCLSQ
jgi:hypothetical protein